MNNLNHKIENRIQLNNRLSWFISFLMGLITTVVISNIFHSKIAYYELETVLTDGWYSWYLDFQQDHRKERIDFQINQEVGIMSMYISNEKDHLLDQLNITTFLSKKNFNANALRDLNKDGQNEYIFFSERSDSVFINIFNYSTISFPVSDRFITSIGGINSKKDYKIKIFGIDDVNGDQIDEIYFFIVGGYAKYPRRIYCYDYANDSLISSMNTGAKFVNAQLIRIGKEFSIIACSNATGNVRPEDHLPYPDSCNWIFGFDSNLELSFTPISRGVYPSGSIDVLQIENEILISIALSSPDSAINRLYKINRSGEFIDSIDFDPTVFHPGFFTFEEDRKRYFISEYMNTRLFEIRLEPFSLIPAKGYSFLKYSIGIYRDDIDGNGVDEFIITKPYDKNYLLFKDEKFSRPTVIPVYNKSYTLITTKYNESDGSVKMFVNGDDGRTEYRLIKSKKHKYRYAIWVFTLVLTSGVFYLAMFLQRRITLHRRNMEKQISDLQIKNIRNQLDPHFTFNALNSVGNAIYSENKEQAYDMFQRFTRMIRSYLTTSESVFHSLYREIEFCNDYLEFQKVRFKERFDFSFSIEDGIKENAILIPKMLIQVFIENSVKHAFTDLPYPGHISVSIRKKSSGIEILVEDNGIGFKASERNGKTNGTNKGNRLIADQVAQINRLYHTNIQISIIDKTPIASESSGIRVIIALNKPLLQAE